MASKPYGSPREPTGHAFKIGRRHGPAWHVKYRLPGGRQGQKKLGPAWKRARPAAGWLLHQADGGGSAARILDEVPGDLRGRVETGATFADAAAKFLRFIEYDRNRKPGTVAGYQSIIRAQLLPVFGDIPIESITTTMIEAWIATVDRKPSTKRKALVLTHGILKRARRKWGLRLNPVADVEKPPTHSSGDVDVFSPEEVMALVRAAASPQDGAIYLTAAFTGLRRGELIALRWRDVDFAGHVIRVRASYLNGHLTTPKSGKVRAVPMAPDVAQVLARLGDREHGTGDDDLVFVGDWGGYVDARALTRRYLKALKHADLRRLRFHDLRHTFGTRMIAKADIRRVQEWMGHADVQTTMKYLHYAPREEDAALVAEPFRTEEPAAPTN